MLCPSQFLARNTRIQRQASLQLNNDGNVLIPEGGPIVNVAYLSGYHSAKDALQTRAHFKSISTAQKELFPGKWTDYEKNELNFQFSRKEIFGPYTTWYTSMPCIYMYINPLGIIQ